MQKMHNFQLQVPVLILPRVRYANCMFMFHADSKWSFPNRLSSFVKVFGDKAVQAVIGSKQRCQPISKEMSNKNE